MFSGSINRSFQHRNFRLFYACSRGSALVLAIMMIVLLTLELAIISLISIRGLGEEGLLLGQNVTVKRAAETGIQKLQSDIYTYMAQGKSASEAEAAFAQGGTNDLESIDLQTTNPDGGGAGSTGVTISAWVQERRGYYFHIVGRAQYGGVDNLMHRWVKISPCGSQGVLTTILDGRLAKEIDNGNYRAYISEEANPGQIWTWNESTGLSTLPLGAGLNSPFMVADNTGRAWFGATGASNFWTWAPDTGLSTLLPATITDAGDGSIHEYGDRIYFGSAVAGGQFFTWSPTTGLSTILPAGENNPGNRSASVISDGRIFFSEPYVNPGSVWTWKLGVGLTTIINGLNHPGDKSLVATDDGRVFFGEDANPGGFYTWKNGVLSTILTGRSSPGFSSTRVASDGRVYFGEFANPGLFWTWKDNGTATGLFSTILPGTGVPNPGNYSITVGSDGRVFFGLTGGNGNLWTWDVTTGLSTLLPSSISNPGNRALSVTQSGRLFIPSGSNTACCHFYTWHKNTGLSTLTSTLLSRPGVSDTTYSEDDRVFFGESTGSFATNFWTWHPQSGLRSILPVNETSPGEPITVMPDGRVVFSEGAVGSIWTWKATPCD